MFGLTIFTFLVHTSLDEALGPLLYNLPRTLAAEELYSGLVFDNSPLPTTITTTAAPSSTNPEALPDGTDAILPEMEPFAHDLYNSNNNNYGYEDEGYKEGPSSSSTPQQTTTRGGFPSKDVEGLRPLTRLTFTFLRQSLYTTLSRYLSPFFNPLSSVLKLYISPPHHTSTSPPPNMVQKFLHPEIYADYHLLRSLIPDYLPVVKYKDEEVRDVYFHPCMGKENDPTLWIPRDKGGVSKQEVAHTGKVIPVSDQGVFLDDMGYVVVEDWQQGVSPVLRKRIRF